MTKAKQRRAHNRTRGGCGTTSNTASQGDCRLLVLPSGRTFTGAAVGNLCQPTTTPTATDCPLPIRQQVPLPLPSLEVETGPPTTTAPCRARRHLVQRHPLQQQKQKPLWTEETGQRQRFYTTAGKGNDDDDGSEVAPTFLRRRRPAPPTNALDATTGGCAAATDAAITIPAELPATAKTESPTIVQKRKDSFYSKLSHRVPMCWWRQMILAVMLVWCTVTPTWAQTPTEQPTTPVPTLAGTTTVPTFLPSPIPTPVPSPSPVELIPTVAPTESRSPSLSPTSSLPPSSAPSSLPTESQMPSTSQAPSTRPSFEQISVDSANFRMTLLVEAPQEEFNGTEVGLLEDLLESYTDDFAPTATDTTTLCLIQDQSLVECSPSNLLCTIWGVNVSDPNSTDGFLNDIDFFCSYTSRRDDVTGFPEDLASYTDRNLDLITEQMQNDLQLPVIRAFAAGIRTATTESPTLSPVAEPTISPFPTTLSPSPSVSPTADESPPPDEGPPSSTGVPTVAPTLPTDTTAFPTFLPSGTTARPTTTTTTPPPSSSGGGGVGVGTLVGAVVAAGVALLVGLVWFYRRRRKQQQRSPPLGFADVNGSTSALGSDKPKMGSKRNSSTSTGAVIARGKDGYRGGNDFDPEGMAAVAPSPSGGEDAASKRSLISHPGSLLGDDSDAEEEDGTRKIQDEFDKEYARYRDENLDLFRPEVERNVPGFEGVMSAAIMRVLMDPDDAAEENQKNAQWAAQVTWGCGFNATDGGPPQGAEIEASVLCEVNDWMKRHEGGTLEQKRSFMQDVLNRMVTSVRSGVVQSSDASLTIHESAALLGLQLANELPMTTLIISGMRKTAAASHMISVLKEFGVIDVAAVASNQKGFGIVRFRHPKSVDRVLRRYRSSEIVIQDVAVQIKALMPKGDVQGRG